jgi:hypothetical protein
MQAVLSLYGSQLSELAKPLVTYLVAQLQKLFPEEDYSYANDEFVRDTPGLYELQLRYYHLGESYAAASMVFIDNLRLVRPGGIQRDEIRIGKPLNALPFAAVLFEYLEHYVPFAGHSKLCDEPHVLILRW